MGSSDRTTVPRIVLDTNVCLDLFLFRDPACAPLAAALAEGQVCAVADAACRNEWLRVLEYPSVPIRPEQREGLRERFDATVACLDDLPDAATLAPLPRCADPDDQKFLEVALASGADWLLSKDRHLLKLARRTRKAGLFLILKPEQWSPVLIGRTLLREGGWGASSIPR
jgi:predicted nucleic acid-binding protein